MPKIVLALYLLLSSGLVWASSDDNFWLPLSYREWLPEMRDEAKVLEQANPECLQVIRAALQENQSTIEHPVFRLVCRDAANSSFSVLVDAISHEQTYANPMRSPAYRAQKAEEERVLSVQKAEEERQAQLLIAQARLQTMQPLCEPALQKQIRFMHKFSWVGDGFGELQLLPPVAPVATAAADGPKTDEPAADKPVAVDAAPPAPASTEQTAAPKLKELEKPQSEEQIQRLIEQAEQAAKIAAAKGESSAPAAAVAAVESTTAAESTTATESTTAIESTTATESTPPSITVTTSTATVAPAPAAEVWFAEGDFDAEDPYGRPLQYRVRCTIPADGEDVIIKIFSRRQPAKP